jgi:hypothetical protein
MLRTACFNAPGHRGELKAAALNSLPAWVSRKQPLAPQFCGYRTMGFLHNCVSSRVGAARLKRSRFHFDSMPGRVESSRFPHSLGPGHVRSSSFSRTLVSGRVTSNRFSLTLGAGALEADAFNSHGIRNNHFRCKLGPGCVECRHSELTLRPGHVETRGFLNHLGNWAN